MQEPPSARRPEERPPTVVRTEVPDDEESRPASIGQLRTVRRWLLVTGVWAIAATAIAVIALVVANREDTSGQRRTAGQIARVQRTLIERIDELESRIGELPTSDDVSNLDDRLKELENGTSRTGDRLDRLSGRLDDVETRIEELEQQSTETTPTETAP